MLIRVDRLIFLTLGRPGKIIFQFANIKTRSPKETGPKIGPRDQGAGRHGPGDQGAERPGPEGLGHWALWSHLLGQQGAKEVQARVQENAVFSVIIRFRGLHSGCMLRRHREDRNAVEIASVTILGHYI